MYSVAVEISDRGSTWGYTALDAQAMPWARSTWMAWEFLTFGLQLQPRIRFEGTVVKFGDSSRGRSGEDEERELERLKGMCRLADLQDRHWIARTLSWALGAGWDSVGDGPH